MAVCIRNKAARLVVFIVTVLAVVCVRPATRHARAASVLVAFADPSASPVVTDERVTFALGGETIPARVYATNGVDHPPAVVLVHGVHRDGIDEVRLERFARAVANTGVLVMTPLLEDLSDYKVKPHAIDVVGAAVEALRARASVPKVGLMGMSFGGGISLLAAADPRFCDHVAFVVAVGAHDDLGRVSRFFVEDAIQNPDGSTKRLHAHGYGPMVLVYSHIEDFFPPADSALAAEALRLWLAERRDDARRVAAALSRASKAKIDGLFDVGASAMKAEILAEIDRRADEMAAVSPHGHLAALSANVYLLHGEGDTVVPSSETLWLADDVPADRLREALVSPAIEHVEVKSPTAADQWALVHFMAQVLAEADMSR
jgi:dienelactone hydrolase